MFIVYDGRACGQATDTFDCQVMVSCDSLKEARSYNGDYGQVAIYSYDIDESKKPPELINEQWEEDYYP